MKGSGRWIMAGLLFLAGLALWLLLAGPERLLGIDTGNLGVAVLMTVAWVSMVAILRMPRDGLESLVSPGEWRAWLGLGFMLVATVYFLANVQVFEQGPPWANPAANRVGRNLVLMLVAWTVLSNVMASRWKGLVQEDERDREIEKQANGWGRGALTFCIIGLAVMLAFSSAHKLEWATHFMIANLLVFALMWGWLCEYAATAIYYLRDRL